MTRKFIALACCVLQLGACVQGPDYVKPTVDMIGAVGHACTQKPRHHANQATMRPDGRQQDDGS